MELGGPHVRYRLTTGKFRAVPAPDCSKRPTKRTRLEVAGRGIRRMLTSANSPENERLWQFFNVYAADLLINRVTCYIQHP
jgi:hypothetical protein